MSYRTLLPGSRHYSLRKDWVALILASSRCYRLLSPPAVLHAGPVALDQLLAHLEPGGLGLLRDHHAPVLVSHEQVERHGQPGVTYSLASTQTNQGDPYSTV